MTLKILIKIFLLCGQSWIVISHLLQLRSCQPPSTCIPALNCPVTSDNFFTKFWYPNYCGFEKNMMKICCWMGTEANVLTTTTTTTSTTTESVIRVHRWSDDLVNHKNFDLLPINNCGVISSRFRVTAGSNCSPGEFPWMALIAYKTESTLPVEDFKCGGTLINRNYILTAGHCINNLTIFGIRLGEHNILTDIDCDNNGQNCRPPVQDLLIDKMIIHPSYNPLTFANDIALIRLETPANYSYDNVRPICLPFSDYILQDLDGQLLTVAGWGAMENGKRSMTLRKVNVPVISMENCEIIYENIKPISEKQICAGADRGRDSCAGDSGGPLKRVEIINELPRYVQYGIVSFGPTKCGISGRPGIYTNVAKYVRWILDNIE